MLEVLIQVRGLLRFDHDAALVAEEIKRGLACKQKHEKEKKSRFELQSVACRDRRRCRLVQLLQKEARTHCNHV